MSDVTNKYISELSGQEIDEGVKYALESREIIEGLSEKVNNLTLEESKIYGAQWDKSSNPVLTRTDHAANAIVNVGVDKEIVENTMDLSGIFKDFREVTDDYGNVFIRIPKTYIKKTNATEYFSWKASRKKMENSYLPWLFWDFDKNKELDYVDIGKYLGSLSEDGTRLESKPGKYPLVNKTIVQIRNLAMANGLGYQQLDIHAVDLLQTLFIIEQGTLHSQSKVTGFTSGQYSATHVAIISEVSTNRIVITNAKAALFFEGQSISIGTSLGGNQIFYGRNIVSKESYDDDNTALIFDGNPVNISIGNIVYNSAQKTGFSDNILSSVGSMKSNSSGKFSFKWHDIESLYGDTWQFVDGANINENQGWICKDAKKYASNVFTAPYEQLGYINGNANGYLTQLGFDPNHPYAQFPISVGGGTSTYYSDYYYQSTGQRIACFGGAWTYGSDAGLFSWNLNTGSSNAIVALGSRLLRKALV